MKRFLVACLLLTILFSCTREEVTIVDVSAIEVNFTVQRFDQEFYNSDLEGLSELKKKYEYLFPKNVHDSVWVNKLNNEEELFLFNEADSIFGEFNEQKEELSNLFKHIKYYNPKFEAPNVVTHISNLDYKYPVIYADSLMLISLDMYLGSDNIVYKSFPKYLTDSYKKEHLQVDVANSIIERVYHKKRTRVFLNRMVEEGKRMYLLDAFLPSVSDDLKMDTSPEKIDWVVRNEVSVWQYFIENELLYSTDTNLNARFIEFGPFSKFYLEADQDSPGKIGVWIGWQIVKSYMENNDVSLQEMLATDADVIYKKSKYKPKK